jgi:hypothetical protein
MVAVLDLCRLVVRFLAGAQPHLSRRRLFA